MFNPLIDSMSNLTDNELDEKISELGRKYFLARNPQLQQQISTILEMYKEEALARRARARLQQDQQNGENGLDNLININ